MGRLLRGKKLILALITLSLVFSLNVVADSNTPPTKPVLIGVNSGKINTTYTFTALSTDIDEDEIKYSFCFGDDTDLVFSDFLTSGTSHTAAHSWSKPGLYTVTVNVKDSRNLFSDTVEMNVLINAKFCGFLGYIIDLDNDGNYDSFYSNASGEIVEIDQFDIYLIDIDQDGEYDYKYNTNNGTIQSFTSNDGIIKNDSNGSSFGFPVELILVASAFFIISLLLILILKPKKSKIEEKKPQANSFYIAEKKETVKEKTVSDNLDKVVEKPVFKEEIKDEKSKSLQDIEKLIDDL